MISFFIKCGIGQADSLFVPLIWGEQGLGNQLDMGLASRDYGSSVRLFLLMLYVEGDLPMWLPKQVKTLPFSKKESAVSVQVPVRKAGYLEGNEMQRRRFVLNNVLAAIRASQGVCQRNHLDLDLPALLRDVEVCGEEWVLKAKNSSA